LRVDILDLGISQPATSIRDRALRAQGTMAAWLFRGLLLLLVATLAIAGPVLTNDGPSHLSMAHVMRIAGDSSAPMLNRLYEINPGFVPNALGHHLLSAFMLVLPPLAAETALQILVLAALPLAAWPTLRRCGQGAGWLALFFFPIALQRLFFLGLYNFCLSLTGVMLCILAYLRLREVALPDAPRHDGAPAPAMLRRIEASVPARAAQLAMLALLTLASHVSGWMAAALAVGTMVLVETAMRLRAGETLTAILRLPLAVALAFLPSLLPAGLFVLQASGQAMAYGAPPLERILRVVRADAFAPIGRSTALASMALGALLLVLTLAGLRNARRTAQDAATRRLQAAACAVPLAFLLFLLVSPEQAGGGWSHVWRAEVFPQIGLALACATLPVGPAVLRLTATLIAALGSLASIAATAWLQMVALPPVTAEFAEADALIGTHCVVAPVIGTVQLDGHNTARIIHQPLLHIASRFELRLDRPVLYSYLARLTVYPVRYRAGMSPTRALFGWGPQSRTTSIAALDIPRFEAASGLRVDYVLLWDVAHGDRLREGLSGAYGLVHRSRSGRLELYRRQASGPCRDACPGCGG